MDASRYKSEEGAKTLGFWEILWRGFAMGVAELVPGISGGTVAFITNIYRELISLPWPLSIFRHSKIY